MIYKNQKKKKAMIYMFNTSIGLVKPNKEFKLCIAA